MATQTETRTEEAAVFAETRWTRARLDALADTVAGSQTATDRDPIPVTAPAVDEEIGAIPRLDEDAVDDAIAACREAQTAWADHSLDDRAAVLDRFAALVEDNWPELIDLIQLETGKSRLDALEEVIEPPLQADYYAEQGPSLIDDESRTPAFPLVTTAEVVYDPVGVVGVISPWNYPLTLSLVDAIPALLAGNGVVIKPDENTPFTALRMVELLREAGLPEDVCTVVTGDGPEVGGALTERVDYITFTGSTETGRIVGEQAGRNLVDCSLELSGKNPLVVLEDADVGEAVRGTIQACFTNAGQICLAAERVYVVEPLFEEYLDALVEATEALTLGTSFDYDTDVGSIINETQFERVASHVADARERGATVHTGGEKRTDVGPYFYAPTVLTDVPEDALASCEETFGPVITVEPVASEAEAIAAANDSDHGLNASVWTDDVKRGKEVARQIECGVVSVNDGYAAAYAAPDAPMGGMKDSGVGRRHGPEGLKRYVEPKTVATSRIGPIDRHPLVPGRLYAAGSLRLSRAYRRLRKALR